MHPPTASTHSLQWLSYLSSQSWVSLDMGNRLDGTGERRGCSASRLLTHPLGRLGIHVPHPALMFIINRPGCVDASSGLVESHPFCLCLQSESLDPELTMIYTAYRRGKVHVLVRSTPERLNWPSQKNCLSGKGQIGRVSYFAWMRVSGDAWVVHSGRRIIELLVMMPPKW